VTYELRNKGWAVVRIWECRLKKCPEACLRRIEAKLRTKWYYAQSAKDIIATQS
jgi:G:T-mismatch repair DNA endonuclease (very short patch repair protein)